MGIFLGLAPPNCVCYEVRVTGMVLAVSVPYNELPVLGTSRYLGAPARYPGGFEWVGADF
jgi:hypothetical protein